MFKIFFLKSKCKKYHLIFIFNLKKKKKKEKKKRKEVGKTKIPRKPNTEMEQGDKDILRTWVHVGPTVLDKSYYHHSHT